MTRKHFEAIARALRSVEPPCHTHMDTCWDVWFATVKAVENELRVWPSYNAEKFQLACVGHVFRT